jgi:hypothetical protein
MDMELFEDAESKCHGWPLYRRWKEAFLHELIHPIHIATAAETELRFVNAIGVNGLEEDVVFARWIGARRTMVTKLVCIALRSQT